MSVARSIEVSAIVRDPERRSQKPNGPSGERCLPEGPGSSGAPKDRRHDWHAFRPWPGSPVCPPPGATRVRRGQPYRRPQDSVNPNISPQRSQRPPRATNLTKSRTDDCPETSGPSGMSTPQTDNYQGAHSVLFRQRRICGPTTISGFNQAALKARRLGGILASQPSLLPLSLSALRSFQSIGIGNNRTAELPNHRTLLG